MVKYLGCSNCILTDLQHNKQIISPQLWPEVVASRGPDPEKCKFEVSPVDIKPPPPLRPPPPSRQPPPSRLGRGRFLIEQNVQRRDDDQVDPERANTVPLMCQIFELQAV